MTANHVIYNYKFTFLLQEVVLLNGEWENAHFYLAKYYDKLINSVTDIKKTGSL